MVARGKGTTVEACRALGLQRSTYYLSSAIRPERQKTEGVIIELSDDHLRYGYRLDM
jgi:hypothetical protein